MKLLKSIADLKAFRDTQEGSVGFVPTMGALHDGHLSLVYASNMEADTTIVSIYVNPTQFNNANDLDNYPDTLAKDLTKLEAAGVAAVYLPDYTQMYPDDFSYELNEKSFSNELCGELRPGHFTGVLTVVMKLLNLVQPDKAFFGEKDYQQLELIRGMVEAFFIDVEIVGCSIVRENDGLAMSSRNLNLSQCDRKRSPKFHRILGLGGSDESIAMALKSAGFDVEYVRTKSGRRFGAVRMGTVANPVRLIDNVPAR
ncbi:MAG: pantoate--beta-alanine ligase [Pseudomonadales bacterium]|nr:pantoate--beta-alanine ligase [Pseudomonadales bacterium]